MHELLLEGCRVTPLAGYLKGLAVLRLVSEQVDSGVRGRWTGDTFVLSTRLSRDDLLAFFLQDYRPTPIVSPWNGGSGFFPNDTKVGIDAIAESESPRFAEYRDVIAQVRSWPEMPRTFRTVRDVVDALQEAVKRAAPGKKRGEWEQLLADEREAQVGGARLLEQFPDLDTGLAELEGAAKALAGSAKKAASKWWKAVSKIQNKCVGLERGQGKDALLNLCRARLPQACVWWLDAAYAVRSDDTAVFNPVLGTGGNEGRLDLGNNFMQRLKELVLDPGSGALTGRSSDLLLASLFDAPTAALGKSPIGQFDPGRAGGFNQGNGVETKDFNINPWDFVLMLEGAVVLGASVDKRLRSETGGNLAVPFTVRFSGTGFASSQHSEGGRAETWLPIWRNSTGYAEVLYLFREGRCTVGRREVRTGLDFTRAVRTLGVSRGIDQFARYAFVERRGKSYVALPAGRLPVRFDASVRLLDDLDPLIRSLNMFVAGFANVPATFASARRVIDDAIYECSVNPSAQSFSALVAGLGRIETLIAQRDRALSPKLNSPLHGLRPAWLAACDDGTVEVRIAAALASLLATGKVGPIRSNLTGVDPRQPWKWASGAKQQRWQGANLVDRLANVLVQRMTDADRFSSPTVPIRGAIGLSYYDVVPFLYGDVDDTRIEELIWGFTLVDWRGKGLAQLQDRWRQTAEKAPVPRGYAMLKLLHLPSSVRGEELRREPRILALLQADRIEDALAVGRRRLQNHGLCVLPILQRDSVDCRRLLASMLVPLCDPRGLEPLVLGPEQRTTETTQGDN